MKSLSLVVAAFLSSRAQGFGVIPPPELLHHNLPQLVDHCSSSSLTLSSIGPELGKTLVTGYQQALQTDPLRTQIATGVALAVVGDAIAQKATGSNKYDQKRAVSFAMFDVCYRAVQHYLYPPMIALCQGNLLGSLLPHSIAAAMEQALVSQLVIIPLLYYPVFYAITGFVQGLTVTETLDRAKVSFLPIMKRNLMFWIPVQFAVFGAVKDEAAQISILIAAGLIWTIILSLSAGQATPTTPVVATAKSIGDYLPEEEMRRAFPSRTTVRINTGSNATLSDQPEEQLPQLQ